MDGPMADGTYGGASLGEVADALGRIDPLALQALREKHPGAALVFKPGQTFGDGPTKASAACDMTLALLSRYSGSSAQLLGRMRRRLGASWWFDLVAKLTATGGAGGTIAVFLTNQSVAEGTASGLVALLGSGCGLLFSLMQRDAAGGSLIGAYNKMVEAMVEADAQNRALQLLCPQGQSKELDDALAKVDQLARVLNEMHLRYG